MTFEEECESKGHIISVCQGCGAAWCETEGMCLAETISNAD